MNSKNITIMLIIVCLSAATVILGCKKKEEPTTPKTPAMETQSMQKQAAAMAEANKPAEANQTATLAEASIEQKKCPVTGDPIDPNVFVEYKGKKVYFCCTMCIAPFNKNPDKYLAKLPQFQK